MKDSYEKYLKQRKRELKIARRETGVNVNIPLYNKNYFKKEFVNARGAIIKANNGIVPRNLDEKAIRLVTRISVYSKEYSTLNPKGKTVTTFLKPNITWKIEGDTIKLEEKVDKRLSGLKTTLKQLKSGELTLPRMEEYTEDQINDILDRLDKVSSRMKNASKYDVLLLDDINPLIEELAGKLNESAGDVFSYMFGS